MCFDDPRGIIESGFVCDKVLDITASGFLSHLSYLRASKQLSIVGLTFLNHLQSKQTRGHQGTLKRPIKR